MTYRSLGVRRFLWGHGSPESRALVSPGLSFLPTPFSKRPCTLGGFEKKMIRAGARQPKSPQPVTRLIPRRSKGRVEVAEVGRTEIVEA